MPDNELEERTQNREDYATQVVDMYLAHQIKIATVTYQAIGKISDIDGNDKLLLTASKWKVKRITDDGAGNIDATFAVNADGQVGFDQPANDMANLTYIAFA